MKRHKETEKLNVQTPMDNEQKETDVRKFLDLSLGYLTNYADGETIRVRTRRI